MQDAVSAAGEVKMELSDQMPLGTSLYGAWTKTPVQATIYVYI